jgi:hypothetical protein
MASASAISASASSAAAIMQDWSRNGASGQVKRRRESFVLSGAPLPRRGSNQIAAGTVAVSYRQSRAPAAHSVTVGNQLPAPAARARGRTAP